MAIPNGTKFHGVAPSVDTQNKGSDKANAMRDAYTIEEIASHVVAPVGETIDGAAFYVINKEYNGCAVWSDGNNWVVIQAKA